MTAGFNIHVYILLEIRAYPVRVAKCRNDKAVTSNFPIYHFLIDQIDLYHIYLELQSQTQ